MHTTAKVSGYQGLNCVSTCGDIIPAGHPPMSMGSRLISVKDFIPTNFQLVILRMCVCTGLVTDLKEMFDES